MTSSKFRSWLEVDLRVSAELPRAFKTSSGWSLNLLERAQTYTGK